MAVPDGWPSARVRAGAQNPAYRLTRPPPELSTSFAPGYLPGLSPFAVSDGRSAGGAVGGLGLAVQEGLHDGGHRFGMRDEVEVAAVVDVELAARDQPVHYPRVGQGGEGIVVTSEYQGGRA